MLLCLGTRHEINHECVNVRLFAGVSEIPVIKNYSQFVGVSEIWKIDNYSKFVEVSKIPESGNYSKYVSVKVKFCNIMK